jgi:hypothetical protein
LTNEIISQLLDYQSSLERGCSCDAETLYRSIGVLDQIRQLKNIHYALFSAMPGVSCG